MSGGLRHEDDGDKFLILPRPTVRDSRLSFRARGLLAFLADLPGGWDVNATWLVKQGKEGREAVYSALSELRAAGYYRVERRRGGGGRWVSGTAVSKTARPEWAAEYAEQEAARVARRQVVEPIYEPPEPTTDSDGLTPPTDLREAVDREPVDREAAGREPVDREPVGPKEDPSRRTGTESPLPSVGGPQPGDDQLRLVADDGQPAARRAKRRHRLPEDWRPSPELLAKAAQKAPGIDVEAEARKFYDHHRSVGRTGLDWDLAFIGTWMTRAVEDHTRRRQRSAPYRNQQPKERQQQIDDTTAGPPASDGWDGYITGGRQ